LADILPDHDHCKKCDDPVDKGEQFCSELCKDRYDAEQRKEKNRNYLFIGLVAIALIVITLAKYLIH
jgi:predicted nucleic acid-binding Zn ribbon protein